MNMHRISRLASLLALVLAPAVPAAAAPPGPSFADRAHAKAVESFRNGRFSEAYGRFIALAEAGHPASARYALWMCEQGLELFGKDWDCAQHQVEDWARVAGIAAPTIGPRSYSATSGPRSVAGR